MKSSAFFILIFSLLVMNKVCSQDTLFLQPGAEGKDAFLDDWYTENHGDYPNLFALAGTSNGIPVLMRSIFEFDLSTIPAGVYIYDARLSLYFANNPSVPHYQYGDNVAFLQRVTEPWDEHTVTWFNQPASTEENQVILPVSTYPEQDYLDIDVKVLFQDIVNDPENSHGVLFRLQTEEMYRRMFFASSDHENPELHPKLQIIYLPCAPPSIDFDYVVDEMTAGFTGISPTAITWHWDFGDGDTSNVQNPEHIYLQPGFYQVCLRVEDTCYFAEHCEEVEICIAPPVSGFTYMAEGLNVFFQDTSIMAGSYYWDFGDGYFSNLKNPWHDYELNGSYLVCLTTSNSCGADTACEMIDPCIPPVSDFTYTIEDLTVFFEDNSQLAEEYYWDFGDGYFSNLSNPQHTYETIEDYEVCLTTWNDCGADNTCETLFLSTVFIPENDDGTFMIYPNPARDLVFIKTTFTGQGEVRLLDLSGKDIIKQSQDLSGDEPIQFALDHVQPGIYIVRLASGKDQAFGKLVVVK